MRYTIVFVLTLLSANILYAQRIQVSAVIGAGGGGMKMAGTDIKFGTNNEVWDVNVALNIYRVNAPVQGRYGPEGEEIYTAYSPYLEVSANKIIALGIAPYIFTSDGRKIGPLAVIAVSYPIHLYEMIDFVPSFQLVFLVGLPPIPGAWFSGGGVAIRL